jgi:hypothetical protein
MIETVPVRNLQRNDIFKFANNDDALLIVEAVEHVDVVHARVHYQVQQDNRLAPPPIEARLIGWNRSVIRFGRADALTARR